MVCRFSGISNERHAEAVATANYANHHNKRDREYPKWERDARTGGRDPAIY